MLFIGKRHKLLKTMSEQRTTRTRSGRSVKEPARYEPDPDSMIEDDFSDSDCEVDSDEEQYSGCESIKDEEYMSESSDSEEDEDDEEDEDEPTGLVVDGFSELNPGSSSESENEDEDVLDWDCLTDDASDGSDSSDDEA